MSTAEGGRSRAGWTTFAAVVMFAVGFARIVSGISWLRGGDQISDLTNSLFGDTLWVWGIWDLGIAALALFAGYSLLSNGGFGRFVGYLWGVLVIVQGFLIVGVAPWYAAAAIALACLVMYGLAATAPEEGI